MLKSGERTIKGKLAENKINLLVFCYGGDYGGVDAFLENLLPGISDECKITVYSFKEPGFAASIPKDIKITARWESICFDLKLIRTFSLRFLPETCIRNSSRLLSAPPLL